MKIKMIALSSIATVLSAQAFAQGTVYQSVTCYVGDKVIYDKNTIANTRRTTDGVLLIYATDDNYRWNQPTASIGPNAVCVVQNYVVQ